MSEFDLKSLLENENRVIVDVRTLEEYDEGHIEGSINIPLAEIVDREDELRSMGRPLILCCRSGNRSETALAYLETQGFEQVYNGGGWEHVNSVKET